ncbi:proline-, glutamic acid- and leucine-rich protein 1-like [Galleria mellonella]|uniref:Proline-, glutamic acid- and leucine-rich protein 1-like n=1 Tax=Galleria mellonella TaxID=7137 RepID=A0ABM3MG09_GALME|nr:proline-, glutamic acid- and leucine-rich protein 1-like [Galleria mellonella]
MNQILNKVRDVDPNNSEAVKETLTGFFQKLDKHTEADSIRWLRALESIINRFPKYCMSHRNTIENVLMDFLDSNHYYNVIEAAKCAHVLQQVRPTQEKGATPKSSWRDQMQALCSAAYKLVDSIFPNVVDIYGNNESCDDKQNTLSNSPLHLALQNIDKVKQQEKNVSKRSILFTRLKNILVFIQAMLVEIYPVAKPIQPQIILKVIVRILSVTSIKQPNEFAANIATTKTYALRTLDALIACLNSNLIPFSALVIRAIMQTLKWSTENPYKEASQVRCAAYNSFSKWLTVLHTQRIANERRGGGGSWDDELTSYILADITPQRHLVQLTMSSQSTKHLSKKAKRKLANSMLEKSTIASHAPGEKNKIAVSEETNDEVAIAALECAELFLTVCGIFLKSSIHKLFQERLVRECYTINSYSSERTIALLRALEAARKSTGPSVPPPTQYCLHLYSNMVNSQQPEVSKFCSQALLDIRLHLHCSPPSFNFAVAVSEDKQNKVDNKRKKMSERNRAQLEALLGANMMPSENSDSVITIPDEPSKKKPRLEEDITTLSSDSVSSVEISDESDEDNVIEVINVEMNKGSNEKINEDEEMNKMQIQLQNEPVKPTFIDEGSEDLVEKPKSNAITEQVVNESNKLVSNPNIIEQEKEIEPDSTAVNIDVIVEQNNIAIEVDTTNIYEAKTQLPLNISNETTDGEEMALSIEVAYDLPYSDKKVPVLGKMDDENLPSTNDTDDIQITCGQVAKCSQEAETEKCKIDQNQSSHQNEKIDEPPKVNGFKSPKKVINDNTSVETENIINKVAANKEVSVEDMLADFVDEVNDESNCIN